MGVKDIVIGVVVDTSTEAKLIARLLNHEIPENEPVLVESIIVTGIVVRSFDVPAATFCCRS